MPKIEIYKDDFETLVGKKFAKREELEEALLFAKTELEEIDSKGKMKLDVKDTNRPDLWSAEGIARELRGALGLETGLPKYKISPSGIELKIDLSVAKIRPLMVAAVVKGLKFDDCAIEQMIQLQEKVALTYGRKRKEAAIGIFDFDKLVPPLRYSAFADKQIKFTPLGFDAEMSPKTILENHPKGKEYGHLLSGTKFPILMDSKGNVCSMPPIINSAWTGKVTEETRNVFVECTGYNHAIMSTALNVAVSALTERGGKIESVRIIPPKGKPFDSPDFSEREIVIDAAPVRKLLGLDISDEEIAKLLRKARYDAVAGNGKILARYPAYRNDIMHWRDVAEDAGVMFGYNNMQPERPRIHTMGGSLPSEDFCDCLEETMTGLGLQEVMTFILTSKENAVSKMGIKESGLVEISNPVSASWSVMRSWLTPSLLEFLAKNMHADYPQRIFEISDAVLIDEKTETKTKTIRKIGCAISDFKVGYEETASLLDAMMQSLDIKYNIKTLSRPYFIPGRAGDIIAEGVSVGEIGEIHPQVLNNFGLEKAVVVFELDVGKLLELVTTRKRERVPARHQHKVL